MTTALYPAFAIPSTRSLARLQVCVFHVGDVARPDDRCVLGILAHLVVLDERHRSIHELVIGPIRGVARRETVPPPAENRVPLFGGGAERPALRIPGPRPRCGPH